MTTAATMTVGQFTYSTGVPRWSWSDGMFALHGMAPGDVVPTRALFLSHVHPEDRSRVDNLLDVDLTGGQPAASEYRLVDLRGETRTVLIAMSAGSPADPPDSVRGLVVDDSDRHRRAVADGVNAELHRALESHAVIDQAKGALMAVYGVDGDAAFQLLRWASQQRNIRLRVLAERLMAAVQSAGGLGPQVRALVDETLVALLDDAAVPQQQARPAPLRFSFDHRAPVPTLRLVGCVDVMSMGDVSSALNRLIAAGRDRDSVAVDLRGVDRVGAVARFVLTAARRRSEGLGTTMRIVVDAQPASVGARAGSSPESHAAHAR
ncbi:PAS and ANTAR domain-containing protein [Cellulomonas fengjieae]|uniref:ANTAR domain-containing protein n=1 Tax=Cellulomonas fengjieae TaxID=2819978 RepID=A0ABS3SJ34_9CELL|nr:PAS and ANTAR domain-containing protein [Cellulomonas fengjieae]MBO3085763.1 ANTAR domain-containing protein [Cellulomonas fengjieae]QVI67529.1 ANTAR domain-containing protein [Cellulomonas fengjieae]